jgi:hypothetical protein
MPPALRHQPHVSKQFLGKRRIQQHQVPGAFEDVIVEPLGNALLAAGAQQEFGFVGGRS